MRTAEAKAEVARLPWRGRADQRPRLPVPPGPMPLLLGRRLRKRWRWVGAFADNLMAFAAVVHVGPASMTFWGVWDRERRRLWERTRRGMPGRRPEVELPGRESARAGAEREAVSTVVRRATPPGETLKAVTAKAPWIVPSWYST